MRIIIRDPVGVTDKRKTSAAGGCFLFGESVERLLSKGFNK